ncbi:hypothetical protein PAECIP111894_04976 [Paenibacillus pseudetheri]|jgi:hypothetical protein|uniref:Phage protein n=1 Tax=Paenibacillus pseudetheri TaxID=2897682 RepID=A0ABN8FSA5_9BACL|nr:hypothetical protein PAECIP111894_04976 [Paenibacillus pseudetheri]
MKYVIYVEGLSEFYRGNTYTHQGETFPAGCKLSEAKRYSSKKRAENTVTVLERKCDDKFCVHEIEE